jgi:hypothetical protein
MSASVHDITYFITVTVYCIVCLFFINIYLFKCNCNCVCCSCNRICIVFILCSVSFIAFVDLCAVFCLSVVCYFV